MTERPAPLLPIHGSLQVKAIHPHNMASVVTSHSQRALLEELALGIFTDMTNAGSTFQAALSAIYMTGVQHALSVAAKGEIQ